MAITEEARALGGRLDGMILKVAPGQNTGDFDCFDGSAARYSWFGEYDRDGLRIFQHHI